MPTVSTKWDIKSLIEHYASIQVTNEAVVHGVREFHSNCPWCPGSKDSFVTRPETGQFSHAVRSGGCGRSGDAIDFLMEYVGMSRVEAVDMLSLEDVSFYDAENSIKRHSNNDTTMPSKKWMEAAELLLSRAEKYLWHPGSIEGQNALAYLRGRGLTDETIKKARLGYVPLTKEGRWYQGKFEDWGLTDEQLTETQKAKGGVNVGDGILIPWFVGGKPWKLTVKRPGQKPDYAQITGSKEALYNVDALQYGEISMIVEGEIDCLSVVQEAGDLVNCVATGSKDKGRAPRWIAELSLASFVLQSFDEDPQDPKTGKKPGDEGATFWLELFSQQGNIERWSPMLWKDPNELLQKQLKNETDGYTLRTWVEQGVDLARYVMSLSSSDNPLAREVAEDVEIAPAPEFLSEPEISNELTEQELSEDDKLLIYAYTVSDIVDVLGGPEKVTMTRHDGRSLEQYMRDTAVYTPRTLPALPRQKCAHTLITVKRVSDELSRPVSGGLCKEKPLENGWCEYHAASYQLLELGAKIGYPEVNLGARWILAGVENWEGNAESISPEHAKKDIARIKARYEV